MLRFVRLERDLKSWELSGANVKKNKDKLKMRLVLNPDACW